jgi:LPXTG-site transpeptidase (sortase) family protein
VNDLEALLLAKRRRQTAARVRRIAEAEATPDHRLALPPGACGDAGPVRSPAVREPAGGESPYFRTLAPTPLDGNGAVPESRMDGRRRRDRWLVAFEIVAIIGSALFLGSSYLRLRELNRQTRDMQELVYASAVRATETAAALAAAATNVAPIVAPAATAMPTTAAMGVASTQNTPAPSVTAPAAEVGEAAAYLPGWDRPARANASAAPRSVPAPTAVVAGQGVLSMRRLSIPSIEVDGPVVAGDSWEELKLGIGHHPGSAVAGENGNVVLSAHNDVYGELFRDLDQMAIGDEVFVYTAEMRYRYVVRSIDIVLPTRVEVMAPTEEPILTLITCYPYLLDTHRVVVVADLAGVEALPADQATP